MAVISPPLPEPVGWTTITELDWARKNLGRAGFFYSTKAGTSDIEIHTSETVQAYAAEAVRMALENAAICAGACADEGMLGDAVAAAIRALKEQA